MSIGLNRQNDTPIGGLSEFRANLQGGNVFQVDDVPIFDGEKFIPGTTSAIARGYGGLASTASAGYIADGSTIDNWDQATPLGGTPLQVAPNVAAGVIITAVDGTWDINFQCNITSLANNEDYFFELSGPGGGTGFGTHVVGSNNVSSQSTGFVLQITAPAGAFGVTAFNVGSNTFDIISASLSLTRIG